MHLIVLGQRKSILIGLSTARMNMYCSGNITVVLCLKNVTFFLNKLSFVFATI